MDTSERHATEGLAEVDSSLAVWPAAIASTVASNRRSRRNQLRETRSQQADPRLFTERLRDVFTAFEMTIEALPQAILLIDRRGAFAAGNTAARAVLAGGSVVSLRAGVVWIPALRRPLDAAYLRALKAPREGDAFDESKPVRFRLPGVTGQSPWCVVARRVLTGVLEGFAERHACWCITIVGPAAERRPSIQALRETLELTPAEGRLVTELYATGRLCDAARRLKIAHETARSQLRTVFQKCDVRSQAELLQLVALGPFFCG